MAIYHLSVKPVSRSAGRSATAAAAYRAGKQGTPILDERTGQTHDYTRKGGVESADIVLPDNAPAWAKDRAALWNAAERAEKRKDACVAREYEVALPSELPPEERRRLAVDFAQEMANREGCAVDACIHAPGRGGDERNHHAHILRTTRKVEAEGMGAKLDTEKAGRNRKDDLEAVRARWAGLVNERLRQHGIQEQIDHRSLEAQGATRPPTEHRGPAVSGLVRRGASSEVARRMAEEADARQSAARETGRIERELDRSILDLSGDLAGATRKREKHRREAERPNFEAMPIETQCTAWDAALNNMAEARRARIASAQAKSLKRTKRREKAAKASMVAQPAPPTGLLASLRQRAYTKAWAAWNEANNRTRDLEQQAINLYSRLRDAATESMAWAATALRQAEPELAQRVETHRQAERTTRLRAEMQEREQKRQVRKGRGIRR